MLGPLKETRPGQTGSFLPAGPAVQFIYQLTDLGEIVVGILSF